jgi:hypothetical protein
MEMMDDGWRCREKEVDGWKRMKKWMMDGRGGRSG